MEIIHIDSILEIKKVLSFKFIRTYSYNANLNLS
jgi:hypothetical protein